MANQSTLDKLREMRMSVAAAAYQDQDTMRGVESMSFDERLAQIVDAEWDSRRSNKRVRLLRQAQLSCPDANVADIVYDADRGLDRSEMIELSNCTWITERRNVVLVGASGAGNYAGSPVMLGSGP